jgi:hypothetical protein
LAGPHWRALLLELLIGNGISGAVEIWRGEILKGLKGRKGRERSRRFEKGRLVRIASEKRVHL